MADRSSYGSYRLKTGTIETLKDMKRAFEFSYARSFTNDEFIQKLVECVEPAELAVWDAYCEINERKAQETGK